MYKLTLHISDEEIARIEEFEQFRTKSIEHLTGIADGFVATKMFMRSEGLDYKVITKYNIIEKGVTKLLNLLKAFPEMIVQNQILKIWTDDVENDEEAKRLFLKEAMNAIKSIYEARENFLEYDGMIHSKQIADAYATFVENMIDMML